MWDLDPDKQAFVNAVLAPLPPDDKARDMLEQSVQVASQVLRDGGSEEARVAAARMQATAPGYRRRRSLLHILGGAVMFGIAWFSLFSATARDSVSSMLEVSDAAHKVVPRFLRKLLVADAYTVGEIRDRRMAERIAPEHRLVALGDLSQESPELRWKAVWDRYPESPAHFMIYAATYHTEQGKWPEDFVATGERLDPENGWFRFLTLMPRANKVLEPGTPATYSRGRGPRTMLTPAVPPSVKDEAGLREILAEWDRVLEKPRLQGYRTDLFPLRMAGLLPPEDYPDQAFSCAFGFARPDGDSVYWRSVAPFHESFVTALADYYVSKGDLGSLMALSGRFVKTLERLAEGPAGLNQRVMIRPASKTAKALADAFSRMADPARESRFLALSRDLDFRVKKAPVITTPDALDERRSSALALNFFSGMNRFTAIEEKDLRGGRLAEYAMIERMLMYEVVLLMAAVILCLWLAGFRERRGPRQLCSRLTGLLRPADRAWVIGLGILLPVAVYLACLYLPWLEIRDFTLFSDRVALVLGLACGLFLCFVLCIVETLRWRLACRAAIAGFGFGSPGLQPGRWIAVLALLSMPALIAADKAFGKWSMDERWIKAVYGSLAALPLLWILWTSIAFFMGPAPRRMQRLTLARATLPYMILAALLAALAIPAFHQEEKYWTRRIVFESVNVNNPRFNLAAGDEYSLWLQEQIRTALADFKKAGP